MEVTFHRLGADDQACCDLLVRQPFSDEARDPGLLGCERCARRLTGKPGTASCAGYLASYASPNNGFVIHELEMPAADAPGVPMGTLQSGFAQEHSGSIAECIP